MNDQRIGFLPVPGGRIAYAEVGAGPPLVLPTPWVSHVELDWELPEFRAFVGALARTHRVIRYDRLGCGLSDRPAVPVTGVAHDTAVLAALIDAVAPGPVALFGFSIGAGAALAYAAAHPERVTRLAVFGGYADGSRTAPAALRASIVATIRAHWGAGSRLLADVWLPGADAPARDAFAKLQRVAADAETAAAVLAAVYEVDIRGVLAEVRAPTLVVHRRNDRAIPFALGREVAAGIAGARFVPLDGEIHPPWLGDATAVLAALEPFLAEASDTRRADTDGSDVDAASPRPAGPDANSAGAGSANTGSAHAGAGSACAGVGSAGAGSAGVGGDGDGGPAAAGAGAAAAGDRGLLSAREREVLRLVASGHSDARIAAELFLSAHTVHRHVANIRRKLDQPSRAAAAAAAIRLGLI